MSYKTTNRQYKVILAFMQQHGDLCAPSGGAKKRAWQNELWTELTTRLNQESTGYTKTTDKWIKVWCDWKTRTKKKVLDNTPPGKHSKASLTDIEGQLIAFLGWNSAITSHEDVSSENKEDSELCSYEKIKPETFKDDMNIVWNKDNTRGSYNEIAEEVKLTNSQDNKLKVKETSSDHDGVDSKDTSKAVTKMTHSHRLHKKMKHCRHKPDSSTLYKIFENFSKAEQRRLEVELTRQRNKACQEKISFRQTKKQHNEILDFTISFKKTFTTLFKIYSKDVLKK